MEKLQEIELTIKNADDGVFAVSLVESPAIEEDFVFLSAEEVKFKVVDEERRIVVGFALVPEKRILRLMGGKKFNIYFTKETVAKASEEFMRQLMLNKFTADHESPIEGVSVIESWIVEDAKHDKSNIYGLGAKGGEWVLMSKIYNDEVWNEVKAGKFKGYSIEARFDGFEQLQSKTETMEEQIIKELNAVLSSQKVELGAIDDFIQALDNMVLEPSGNVRNKINGLRADLNKIISELEGIQGRVGKVASVGMGVEKAVKDLGLELPGNYKSAKDRLFTEEASIKKSIASWKSAAQGLINP